MPSNARDRGLRDDAGFTLIELLITIVIIGVIMSAITISVVMGFESTASSERRLDRSNVAEFTARYFTADAISSDANQAGATPCPGAGTALTILGDDGTTVSYATVTSAGRTALVRRTCGGALPATESEIGSSRVPASESVAFDATGACPTSPPPPAAKVSCSLTVTWADGDGDFTLSGTRRSS